MKETKKLTELDFENYFRLAKRPLDFLETECFHKFMEYIKNDDLFEKCKFVNEIHSIPPVESFLTMYDKDLHKYAPLSKGHRSSLTACFGYLFCVVLNNGYTARKVRKNSQKAKEYGYLETNCFVKENSK